MSNKERPIIFSAPMVRAMLAGEKTQTRRVVKPQPPHGHFFHGVCICSTHRNDEGKAVWAADESSPFLRNPHRVRSPYGQPGDRLWVRETFMDLQGTGVEYRPDPRGPLHRYAYQADTPPGSRGDEARKEYGLKWKPSIHMPRHASRITLEITAVRVERLHDISESDCWAEGIEEVMYDFDDAAQIDMANRLGCCIDDAKPLYALLWEKINGKGSWDANPWVWVVEHKRIAQEEGAA